MKLKKILSFFLSALLILTVISGGSVTSFAYSEDKILFEEDFDDYAVKEYTKDEIAAKNTKATFDAGWTSAYEVKKTASGKKYLKITFPTTKYTGGGYKALLAERFTQGNLVVEMKVLPEKYSPNLIFKYLQVDGKVSGTETGKNYEIIGTTDGEYRYIRNGILSSGDAQISNDGLAVDDDGFWNLRLVYGRESTDDNWSLAIYNAYNGSLIKSKTSIAESAGIDVTGIRFVDMYAMNDSTPTQFANIADMKIYIPADVVVTRSADYDADEKKVIFTASEKLLRETVNEETVTITSPTGGEVIGDVSLADNGLDIVASFQYGLPEDGTYTLTAEGVQTERNVPVAFSESFEGIKAVIPFAVTEASPGEGVISAQQQSITLSFTKEPDDKLLNEIVFKTADGDDIPGLYETEVSGKDVVVSFGKLNPGDYVLTAGADFADKEDGTKLGEDYVINYTVEEPKADGEDFESDAFVSGTQYTAQQIQGMSKNLVYNASGKYSVHSENGDKFLKVATHSPHSEGSVAYLLPEAVTDGVTELDLKIKGSGDNLARHVLRVYGNSGNVYLLSMNNGSDITISTNTNNAGGSFCDDAPKAGADGFFSLKLRLTAGNYSEDWILEIFDTSDSERLFYSTTVARSKLSDITKISAGEIWPVSDAETERSISISEMWFSHSDFVSVIEAPETILPTDETLVFKLDDDIDADELAVELISEDNAEISCECTYSAIERKLYVKPQSFLTWGMTYTLKTTGADIKPYTFAVSDEDCAVNQKKVSYTTESGTVYDMPVKGSFDASVYASIDAPKGREIMIVFAAYDAKGYPIKLEYKNVVSSNGSAADTVTIEGLTGEECKTVQCFVWEKTAFGYKVVK